MDSKRSRLRGVGAALLIVCLAATGCQAQDAVPGSGRTGAAVSPASSPAPASTAATPSPAPVKPKIDKKALDYFFKIALGAEYGTESRVVSKWSQPVVLVHVNGKVTAGDRKCLNRVVADFNKLTATTDVRVTNAPGADIELHYAPVSRFRSLAREYVAGNDGFFTTKWRANVIHDATILIRTSGISAAVRCHLVREELTQSMGLMRDSNDHPSSVFYGRYRSSPTRYSALDKKLIKLLYSGAVDPGDGRKEILGAVTVV